MWSWPAACRRRRLSIAIKEQRRQGDLGFAPALAIARKLARMGVDAIVIEGMEAGGHIGPVSTGVLAQEILPVIPRCPVFVAGGIGRGEAMASYLAMGAAGVQLGTRFVCATESIAHAELQAAPSCGLLRATLSRRFSSIRAFR